MPNPSWSEEEIRATIVVYLKLLKLQEKGESVNKAELYRQLSSSYPQRSPKAFELKFQNISAILFEEKLPYADGLLPRSNYQRLLKLLLFDYLDRVKLPSYSPRDILIKKLKILKKRDYLPVKGKGAGRFGLTLEYHLGIPQNSDKGADFMGIELKTKHDKSLQTLFSRVPSRYKECKDKRELVEKFGYYDEKKQRQALYTSFSSQQGSLGFSLAVKSEKVIVLKSGKELLEYDGEVLEEALLSKHTETAYISVSSKKTSGEVKCRFDQMTYCKWPSILKFLKLAKTGCIFLDFTLSISNGKIRDHGFLWRIPKEYLSDLYLKSESISLSS